MIFGILKTSLKENEKRLAIYPPHLPFINKEIRKYILLENNYGIEFNMSNSDLEKIGYKTLPRGELLLSADILALPKPTIKDLQLLPDGKILWGWTHCVQNKEIVQCAISKKLTYISWENMHTWINNRKDIHIFYKNNEIAGYAAVLHALQLMGIDGFYGERKKVVIFGYGSVSRGAIRALHGRGFNNIHVLSKRDYHLISYKDPDVYYKSYRVHKKKLFVDDLQEHTTLTNFLKDADIIVNGVLQDVNNPLIFIRFEDLKYIKTGCLIIDISCDKGMGFEFACPTTFEEPMIEIEDIYYYSVDHTPTYLWRAASREISLALLPFIPILVKGIKSFKNDPTLLNAIDIDNGVIKNADILSFQKRKKIFPHEYF